MPWLLGCTPPVVTDAPVEVQDSAGPAPEDSPVDSVDSADSADSAVDTGCQPVALQAEPSPSMPTTVVLRSASATTVQVSFESTTFETEVATERTLWGLPPETPVTFTPACGEPLELTTGYLEGEEGLPLEVTVSTRDRNDIRFLMPVRREDGSNVVVMLDELGRVVWKVELPTSEYMKALTAAPGVVYVHQDSGNENDFPILYGLAPDGSATEHQPGVVLHHDLAIGPDGALYGLGWDKRQHEGYDVLGDTLFRFDLEGNAEVLWNAWDQLEPPDAQWLSEREGKSGLYRGDVILWTYVNSVTVDWPTGNIAATNGAGHLGPIVLPEGWLFHAANTEKPEEIRDLGQVFDQIHSAWLDDQDRLMVYNRRQGTVGASVDSWTLDREQAALGFVGSYRGEDDDGTIPNETVGAALPVDNRTGAYADLTVVSYPNPRRTLELVEGAFEGTDHQVVLRLAPTTDDDHEVFIGYVEAYSLGFLNGG